MIQNSTIVKTPYRSKISAVDYYVPPKVVTNHDLTKFMDTSDEWIQTRSGITERRWVEADVSTSDLGLKAAEKVLAKANVSKQDIDCIMFATISPDHEFPGTGCFFQAKLGLPGVPAIEVRQACSGFIYGMGMADSFIRSGMYKNILLIGAEVHSKGLDLSTRGRDVSVLFGDGAGAAIITRADSSADPSKDSMILSTHLHADGSFAKELYTEAPGTGTGPKRLSVAAVDDVSMYPKMNGKTVFMHASRRMPEVVMEAIEFNGLKLSDVDLFVFHQANQRINEMVAKQLEIDESKVFNTISKFGNTTAATIPIGLSEAEKAGKLKKGMLVASAVFGSGFTWASALYRW